jgi:glycosyltransferase involved in cell wall biosynthesis
VRVLLCTSDTRLLNAIDLPSEQVTWRPWVPFAEWPGLLASFDIGIAPLYGDYDQRRCWTQALEYMIQRIPWVASAGPVFQDLAQYGWLVNPQPKAWERVLLDIVDHLDEYRLEAERDAYLFALSQSIDENIDKVMDTYTRIASSAARNGCLTDSVTGSNAG